MTDRKILILGDGGVGKSCLVNRFVGNEMPEDYDATIFDKYRHDIPVDGKVITVELHDTAGQEEFIALWDDWIREGDGAILVYSVAEQKSFDVITTTLHPLILRTRESDAHTFPIALCGNKQDLPAEMHKVDSSVAKAYAEEHGWGWCEVSAKNNFQVKIPFQHVARELLKTPHVTPGGGGKKPGLCTLL